jgi:hypothetical protein
VPPQIPPPSTSSSGGPAPLAPAPPPTSLAGYDPPPRAAPSVVPQVKPHRLKTVVVSALVVVVVLIVAAVGFLVIHGKFVEPPPYPAAAKAIPPASWVRTAASDGSFSVAFPTAGNVSTDSKNPSAQVLSWTDPKHPAFLVEGGNIGPHDPTREQDALDQALVGVDQDIDVTSTLTVPFQNHAARAVSGKDHGIAVKALAFFSGNSLYVLAVEGPTAVANADTFFNSFQAAA